MERTRIDLDGQAASAIADALADFRVRCVRYGILEAPGGSGNRPSAAALRNRVENTKDNHGKPVVLDFDGVAFCSSAFIRRTCRQAICSLWISGIHPEGAARQRAWAHRVACGPFDHAADRRQALEDDLAWIHP